MTKPTKYVEGRGKHGPPPAEDACTLHHASPTAQLGPNYTAHAHAHARTLSGSIDPALQRSTVDHTAQQGLHSTCVQDRTAFSICVHLHAKERTSHVALHHHELGQPGEGQPLFRAIRVWRANTADQMRDRALRPGNGPSTHTHTHTHTIAAASELAVGTQGIGKPPTPFLHERAPPTAER
jgi:hypothetical protein